jgi:ABC transport system ATP-binding/permease protein
VRKLSFNEKRELGELPGRIEKLEEEQEDLHQKMAAPTFYQQGSEKVTEAQEQLTKIADDLAAAYARWEELSEIEEGA